VVFHDVSEAKAMAHKITHLAEHDMLTSLPNRGVLDARLEQGIALAQRHSRRLAVLFIDLDHFKHINDSLGHLIGDELLQAVARRITPCVRSSDTVSRQGGNEFIVVLSEISRAEDAALIGRDKDFISASPEIPVSARPFSRCPTGNGAANRHPLCYAPSIEGRVLQ
jgi:diguanylate cyclase (GGDEF)-like protein